MARKARIAKFAKMAKIAKFVTIVLIAKIAETEIVSFLKTFKIWVSFEKLDGFLEKRTLNFIQNL